MNGATEYRCGCLLTDAIGAIADRAARRILEYKSARPVTVDPAGVVWVESFETMVECDLVATYRADAGILGLSRLIADDLRLVKQERGFVGRKRRIVTGARRAA